MKIKKTILVLLFVAVAIFFCQNKVLAASTVERTTTLDITSFTNDESNANEGWSWDSATNTLTLTDVNFNTGTSNSIIIPSDKDVNIVLNGKNKLTSNDTVISRGHTTAASTGTTIFRGTGELELNSKNELPTIDINNLLLKSGTINAIGGSVDTLKNIKIEGGKITVDTSNVSDNGWNDGLYACGNIEISDGEVNINSNRIGLYVEGSANTSKEIGLKITGGNISVFGKMVGAYVGFINAKDVYIDTTGTINFKNSSIGIYLYNGDLTIVKGKLISKTGSKPYIISSDNTTGVVNITAADYTKVNKAIAKIPADLSKYTDVSIEALNAAKNAVVNDKKYFEQNIVDSYATAIENAIKGLKYKPADYTKVNAAIAKIPVDLSQYTDASIEALNAAKQAVIDDKNITEQSIVDSYATAIENAIKGLEYKKADYSKVDAAIAKIPADLSNYTDESVRLLNAAKQAVVNDKNITEQNVVDDYATAIENAIKDLKHKIIDDNTDNIKDNTPKTGVENNSIILATALACTAIISMAVIEIKKK